MNRDNQWLNGRHPQRVSSRNLHSDTPLNRTIIVYLEQLTHDSTVVCNMEHTRKNYGKVASSYIFLKHIK